jgi:hypothetical protein
MRGKPQIVTWWPGAIVTLLVTSPGFAQSLDDIYDAEAARIRQAQAAQDEVDAVVEATRDDFEEYQRVLREVENLEVYNTLQQRIVTGQLEELDRLRDSIANVQVIERQILPLMQRMIDGLAVFIELDIPFLLDERRSRVARLRDLVDAPDYTVAEKFRDVMQAWQIENDYGTFNGTYTAELEVNGVRREVDFLQIGRTAFLYLTPDQRLAGVWDQRKREWVQLDDELRNAVIEGLEIVRTGNPASAELFLVPVAPPEE